MKEQVLTIYESLLMITGYTRIELNEVSESDEEIIPAQRVMVKMLSKILKNDEIKNITGIKGTEIIAILKMALNEKETTIYNLSWDLYVRMMHDLVKQKKRQAIIFHELWNPFSSPIMSGMY